LDFVGDCQFARLALLGREVSGRVDCGERCEAIGAKENCNRESPSGPAEAERCGHGGAHPDAEENGPEFGAAPGEVASVEKEESGGGEKTDDWAREDKDGKVKPGAESSRFFVGAGVELAWCGEVEREGDEQPCRKAEDLQGGIGCAAARMREKINGGQQKGGQCGGVKRVFEIATSHESVGVRSSRIKTHSENNGIARRMARTCHPAAAASSWIC